MTAATTQAIVPAEINMMTVEIFERFFFITVNHPVSLDPSWRAQ